MKRVTAILAILLFAFAVFAQSIVETTAPAPEPEVVMTVDPLVGWGTETRGGLDGRIIRVTNLNSSGPGSFAEAIKAEGPRTVVFEVGGVIDLDKQQIKINNPYLTIAGQTAPSPGITIIRGGLTINTHDVVIQHVFFRMGDADDAKIGDKYEPEISTGGNGNAYNVVVDHCSVAWGVDENLSVSGKRGAGPENASRNITFSNNFISECLAWSVHSKQTMNHSMGTLVMDDCTDVAIIGNFYAHNYERNPWFKGNSSGIVVNNLIYDPGAWAIRLSWIPKEWKDLEERPSSPKISIVGNYEKEGPCTEVVAMIGSNYPENDEHGYMEDNIIVKIDGVTPGNLTHESIPVGIDAEKPIWYEGLNVLPASEVPEYVLWYAGARPAERDAIDLRLIEEYRNGTGKIINSQREVGGYPSYEPTYRELPEPTGSIEEWLIPYTYEVMVH
ncbi:MAG: right-handed parallel beta-helix repeat-containing protein [Sphaerochaetaceae bacterium]|nr:right-handed parallel beta-helix repeat-containing protein [Sphaerochaetaceae bacterium]